MAFSLTLSQLDLSGSRLALSLLGFNIGIELMQLGVVVLVLPPLLVIARTSGYGTLRLSAAMFTLIAALGWLLACVGMPNPVAAGADRIVDVAPLIVAALWTVAVLLVRRAARPEKASPLCRLPICRHTITNGSNK